MRTSVYTAVTFAPVQGFIEKSRKLRDLYGSSYLLSYLSWAICYAAHSKGCEVVSPALPNVTQGMPNQIIIEGAFQENDAKSAFYSAWKCVTETCREWIEQNINNGWEYYWQRDWQLWATHAWEFFWVQGEEGETISDVRQHLNENKRSRGWIGINWTGESSTLSGTDAVAWSGLGRICDPRRYNYYIEKTNIENFYEQLSQKLGETFAVIAELPLSNSKEYGAAFIDPDEELSIPELIKRLVTHQAIAQKIVARLEQTLQVDVAITKDIQQLSKDLKPNSFTDLSRLQPKKGTKDLQPAVKRWTGWFMGDGDKAGDYFKDFAGKPDEAKKTNEFSGMMRKWGENFQKSPPNFCRVIYAGGDDFLGVFYSTPEKEPKLKPKYCVEQFSKFKSEQWNKDQQKPITVSVGFVWAAPGVPQRDVLQHCREAEKSAKNNGRDRIAFRVLFNSGNHLEWVCPWRLLEQGLLQSYRDRNQSEGIQNWSHIYEDVAVLEARHAFEGNKDVALALFEVYFGAEYRAILEDEKSCWWNALGWTGILGDDTNYKTRKDEIKAFNNWIINLAKVGFHLCSST